MNFHPLISRIHAKQKRFGLLVVGASALLALAACQLREGTHTIAARLAQFGEPARARLQPIFARAEIIYPPQKISLVGLKAERELQLYATNHSGGWKFIHTYPILGASGVAGPKLKEWDRQVPEGIYPVELLNPNSRHEVSMQIGYPNAFDRAQAALDGRTNLGGDIMIHGGHTSIGCLAMGDEASADLWILVADTGLTNVTVILAPVDFRTSKSVTNSTPAWTPTLYEQIKSRLAELPPLQNN